MNADALIAWYKKNKRDLPWRDTRNPYHVWLSEIILQQTRVAQGLPYYLKFTSALPDVQSFAKAPQEKILKLWEGLGYYSRARNAHEAAKQVVKEFGGEFPDNYEELKKLKGVGEYTAAAIASFCFGRANAVVDGNVFRVLARLYGFDTPINSTAGKKLFGTLASELLDRKNPGLYNQAIMEFGALQCTPRQPACGDCIYSGECVALRNGKVADLPVKIAAAKPTTRYFEYFLLKHKNGIYIRQRGAGDIWQGLYEFPLLEFKSKPGKEKVLRQFTQEVTSSTVIVGKVSAVRKHQLSHQTILARFWQVELNKPLKEASGFRQVRMDKLKRYPFPVLLARHLQEIITFD